MVESFLFSSSISSALKVMLDSGKPIWADDARPKIGNQAAKQRERDEISKNPIANKGSSWMDKKPLFFQTGLLMRALPRVRWEMKAAEGGIRLTRAAFILLPNLFSSFRPESSTNYFGPELRPLQWRRPPERLFRFCAAKSAGRLRMQSGENLMGRSQISARRIY
jgi:hypothetical protein